MVQEVGQKQRDCAKQDQLKKQKKKNLKNIKNKEEQKEQKEEVQNIILKVCNETIGLKN